MKKKKKRVVFWGISVVLVIIVGISLFKVYAHYQTKNQAEKILDQYIIEYRFPAKRVLIQKIYAPKDVGDAYRKEVHIKGNKEDYYVFTYYTDRKKVDLTGVIDGGEWVDLKDHLYKSLPYQPSSEFLKIYNRQ
ncbi:hypothetical protein NIE88_07605 [Sporolactobacillus shoreicorticis]|uniref:DUF3139 domain-containing protein n=1 Tax=Sporolactobacillus shoreicorticis TaxID=1923877 RepID=A0ABW5S7Q7_9BACL|nr:hypothetical protein [Sporolactobacillus shoreicorticis]MCO7125633.1 hypothetical protein [Sporolactobacillus shoreicorticis]